MATPSVVRGRRNLSEIARAARISPSHASKVFAGRRNMSLVTAAKVARAMGITIDALYARLARLQRLRRTARAA